MERKLRFETVQVHGGQVVDSDTKSRAVPIYQTSGYVFDNAQYAADLFELKKPGNIYTRIGNPTTDVLEKRIAELEGGVGAVATSSGMSAIVYSILTLAKSGDEIAAVSTLYGGTYTLFSNTLKNFGIKVNLVNPENLFATPYLCRPFEFGSDIVVHSATKFICGHGTAIGGVVVDSGKFNWNNGRFPEFVEPDPNYHGLSFYNTFGSAAYITRLRTIFLRDIGACISPLNSFQLLVGLETLSLRMERHVENARKIAEYLENHPKVEWVNYPGLKSNKYHELSNKYFTHGPGAIFTFGIKGGYEAGRKFINSLNIFSIVANVGDAKSLVIHPASTTHQQLSEEEQKSAGVTPEQIRISIGIENIDDLIDDIENALNNID